MKYTMWVFVLNAVWSSLCMEDSTNSFEARFQEMHQREKFFSDHSEQSDTGSEEELPDSWESFKGFFTQYKNQKYSLLYEESRLSAFEIKLGGSKFKDEIDAIKKEIQLLDEEAEKRLEEWQSVMDSAEPSDPRQTIEKIKSFNKKQCKTSQEKSSISFVSDRIFDLENKYKHELNVKIERMNYLRRSAKELDTRLEQVSLESPQDKIVTQQAQAEKECLQKILGFTKQLLYEEEHEGCEKEE